MKRIAVPCNPFVSVNQIEDDRPTKVTGASIKKAPPTLEALFIMNRLLLVVEFNFYSRVLGTCSDWLFTSVTRCLNLAFTYTFTN